MHQSVMGNYSVIDWRGEWRHRFVIGMSSPDDAKYMMWEKSIYTVLNEAESCLMTNAAFKQ